MDKFESLALWMALEISKNSDGDYAKLETRIAWSVWQSRQAEINQLQSQINEMAEVGLSQESAIREKDKRIEEALAIVERFRDKRYPFNVFCNPMEKALRGEHE